jgi:alkanesulfonate monooxygenase SsuD/methylene tetrahydromethanopterin reductase-like flavin-dependent oxidoreductase (luciferase family)
MGVGAGWMKEEFEALNAPPFEERGRVTDEWLQAFKILWTEDQPRFDGRHVSFANVAFAPKPVQKPHPPIWLGGVHPATLRRAARIADGWMGAGGSSKQGLAEAVPVLREALEEQGRDASKFTISKRVFLAVHEKAEVAHAEALRWFTDVYHNPAMLETHGFYGTPEQAREYIEEAHDMGATHLLLNPITRYEEQAEMLAEVVGLK